MATASNPGVSVSYGIHKMTADAIGKTVADVRAGLSQVMNIPANAGAVINGQRVTDDHTIKKGEAVEFVKEAGVKGMPEWDGEAIERRKAWLGEHWQLLVLIALVALFAATR
jgi:hypothetical protein